MIITPKNWKSFQHYKDRNPPWIKLHKTLLDDCDFHCLPDASRALAPMLWLIASEHIDGVINLPDHALAFRLRNDIAEIMEALQPLVNKGFFSCDSAMLASCLRDAVPEERREEKRQSKEREEKTLQPSASVDLSPLKRDRKPRKVQTTCLKEGSVKSFQACWETVPKTFRKWDRETKEFIDDPVSKGSRFEAERNFQAIVDSGVATPPYLYYSFYGYITEGEGPAKGFFQALSTFFGPQKATYLEWMPRGRELALEAQQSEDP